VIALKNPTADLKTCAIFLRVISMATYRGSVGPWSLERLREWDKPVEALYRKIHSCMSCLPRALLYMDPAEDQVGLGLTCLSDRCQEEKWAKIHRAMVTGGDSAVAAEGCLLRAARLCGRPIIAHHGVTLVAAEDDYLLRSVIDWGASAGRSLRFGGPGPAGTTNELVASAVGNDPVLIKMLNSIDAVTLGDLSVVVEEEGVHVRKWVSRRTLRAAEMCEDVVDAGKIEEALSKIPIPTGPITIRVGTCLIPESDLTGDVLEFLGWIEAEACVRRWTPCAKGDKCTPGTWYTLRPDNISRGAGSDDRVDAATLLVPSRKVLMSADVKAGLKKKRHIKRKIHLVLDQGPMEFPKEPPPQTF